MQTGLKPSKGKELRRDYRRRRCPTAGFSSRGPLASYPLLFYTLIAYAGTWLVWLPFLLSADGLGLMLAPVWLASWYAAGIFNVFNLLLYLLFITAWTVVMTWVYNNTRGSVFMAILVHTSADAFPNALLWPLLPTSLAITGYGVYFGLTGW